MSTTRGSAERMVDAAAAFVSSLDESQRSAALMPFPSDDERRLWFYTPTDHGGLPFGQMSPHQQRLAHRLLACGLSRAGYVTASTIIGLENVLDHLEGWTTSFARERGRDPGLYHVRVFGEPGSDAWAWRVGGHHVSVNVTLLGGEVVSTTPCFLGADPAASPLLGPHELRPLAAVEDLARDLVRSLDADQARAAIVSPVPPVDLVGVNRSRLTDGDLPLPLRDVWRGRFEGELLELVDAIQDRAEAALGLRREHLDAVRYSDTPKGLAAASMTTSQQDGLRELLACYLERAPDDVAGRETAKFAGGRLGALHLCWAGGIERGEPHYYRVQGPGLVVEYDNTQRGANHVHSVWRDPDDDFGADALAHHYSTGDHRPG